MACELRKKIQNNGVKIQRELYCNIYTQRINSTEISIHSNHQRPATVNKYQITNYSLIIIILLRKNSEVWGRCYQLSGLGPEA